MSGAWGTPARPTMWSGHWRASNECLVVSKDEDFHRLALLQGAPPKFIWIGLGNCTTLDVAQLLRLRRDDIVGFAAQHEVTVLELG